MRPNTERFTAAVRHAVLSALLLGATAPAHALFGDDEARKAIIDLRGRLEIQNRDTGARLRELSTSVGALNTSVGALSTSIEALGQRLDRLEQLARGQIELQNQIELLKQEIARLRGQVETQTNELAQTQRRQRDLAAEVDGRIKPFEPVSVQIDGKSVTVEADERRSYDAALTAFQAGDFAAAANGLAALRARWPTSGYAANALYWSGAAQFAQKDYPGALASHQLVLARHPAHPRAADALLSVAYCHIEGGDKKAARRSLQQLLERYPDSAAAPQARDRLATLK